MYVACRDENQALVPLGILARVPGWLRAREMPAGVALVALSFSVRGYPLPAGLG